ncbi:MAG: polysaccharide deacetylase family protein [Clostridia bacterium]|nr:polysaccharide deacetylase family protein [Clostridia bacterium]
MEKIMKIWVIGRKQGIIIALTILLLFSGIYIGKTAVTETSAGKRDLPIYCVDKQEKVCAISFDAAWGNEDTHQLIEILDRYNVKTTFFVVGSWVDNFPESVKELSDAGHEIMNHSDSHPYMTKISKEEMIKEVESCDKKIENITGKKPTLFRAPYGDYNNEVVGTMRETGHYTIQWDVDSLDWKNLSAQEITDRVISKVKPGSIVLFHNAALNTPKALPGILEKLLDDGYTIVPVSEIIMTENFCVDNTGKQCAITENKS